MLLTSSQSRTRALRGFAATHQRAPRRVSAPAGLLSAKRHLTHSRRLLREGSAASVVPLCICCHGSVSSVGRRLSALAARPDHAATELRLGVSSRPGRDRPARLHRDAGSSSWSSTSCSAARERITSSASLSAASITCETSARTSCEISGFHLLSLVFSFSAMASTARTLVPRST
jgi:hypothetical protein